MKREREKRYYFIYGNLTEQFSNWYYSDNCSNLDFLRDHPEHKDEFTTNYKMFYDEFALKQKHYTEILHTVVLDRYGSDLSEELYDCTITTLVEDGRVELCFTIKSKQKDEGLPLEPEHESTPEGIEQSI